jgi:hypothetical protein
MGVKDVAWFFLVPVRFSSWFTVEHLRSVTVHRTE